jgi:putative endonuclease
MGKYSYYIYILTNSFNTVLYIGITNNIHRRIYEHKNKLVKGFTSKYNLRKVVYLQEFSNIYEALQAEKTLKGWSRHKKIC